MLCTSSPSCFAPHAGQVTRAVPRTTICVAYSSAALERERDRGFSALRHGGIGECRGDARLELRVLHRRAAHRELACFDIENELAGERVLELERLVVASLQRLALGLDRLRQQIGRAS